MTFRFVLALISGATLAACGGSSSETPYPVEPVPHSVKPLKHNQSGTGGGAAAPQDAAPLESTDQN